MKGLTSRRVQGPVTVEEISGFGYERRSLVRTWCASIDDFARRMGSHRRLRRPKDYKRIGTFSEVRQGLSFETDMSEELVSLRLRGKRSRSMIGDNDWDGVWSLRSKDRSWKRHRARQWRS